MKIKRRSQDGRRLSRSRLVASLFSTKGCKREGETVIKNVSILLLDRYTRSVNLKNANIYVTG